MTTFLKRSYFGKFLSEELQQSVSCRQSTAFSGITSPVEGGPCRHLWNDSRKRECSKLKIIFSFKFDAKDLVVFLVWNLGSTTRQWKTGDPRTTALGVWWACGRWLVARGWRSFRRHWRGGQGNTQEHGAWQGCGPEHVDVDTAAECLFVSSFPSCIIVSLPCQPKRASVQ